MGAGNNNGNRDRLQGVFSAYVLPSFTDMLTSPLASGLQLDYLDVQVNALNQSFVIARKSLKYGFSLSFQRQVAGNTPGFPEFFDYRIDYRPPFSRFVPRRTSFFFGTDQYRPWKFGVTYSFTR